MRGISGRSAMIVLPTVDLDRAVQFYAGLLALSVLGRDPSGCSLEAGGTELRVTLVPVVEPSTHPLVAWRVPSVTDTVAWLRAAGVEAERVDNEQEHAAEAWAESGGARVAWFRDPDGNVLAVVEEARR